MFDHVGRSSDTEAGRRLALAAGVVVVGLAVLGGTTATVSMFLVTRTVVEQLQPDEMEWEVELDEDEPDAVQPPAPPAPRPRRAPSGGPAPEAPPTVVPVVAPPDPRDLSTALLHPASPAQVSSARPPGHGPPTDDPPGDGRGRGPGGPGDEGGTRVVNHPEVHWLVHPRPIYPAAAMSLGLGEVQCQVRIHLDVRGTVHDLEILRCPPAFQPATREALLRWRAVPVRAGDQRVPATFLQNITYKLR